MNLVQINERLKDMPLRAVQMYANGSNPQVPSYLALAELQRREKIAQQSSLENGAADGPMPSIKEQIERRAGLMALQQGRMEQGQQQMANQATQMPMSVPENVESAEEQPQAEDSGIARLPVSNDMYQFRSGGIVAFNGEDNSYVMSPEEVAGLPTHAEQMEALRRNNEVITAENLREAKRRAAKQREEANIRDEKEREEKLRFLDIASPTAAARLRAGFTPEAQPTPAPTAEQLKMILGQLAGNVPSRGRSQTTTPSITQGKPAAAVEPSTATTAATTDGKTSTIGLPAIFTDPAFMDVVKESLKQKTPDQLFQEQQNLLKMYGLTDKAGLEQERRARERQAQYEASRPSGLQDLIRVFGQAGQYKGLSGVAPAYTSLQQQRRAEDIKFREEQDRLMDALEAKRREEAIARAGAIREDVLKGKDIASRTAGTIAGEQLRAQGQFATERQRLESEEKLAGIRFDFEKRLRATPQARHPELKEQYVETLVRRGIPRDQAIEMSMKLGTASDKIDLEGLKALQKTLQTQLEPTSGLSKEARAAVQSQLDQVNRQMMDAAGLSGTPAKVMSMADVRETAAKNNKTIEQVIEAAKSAGYTIR